MRNVISLSVVAVIAAFGPVACSDDLTSIISTPYEEAHGLRVQISDEALKSNQTIRILVENRGSLPVFIDVCPFQFERLEETPDGPAWVPVPGDSATECEPDTFRLDPSALTRFDLNIDGRDYGVYRVLLPPVARYDGEPLVFNSEEPFFRTPTFGVVDVR